MTLRQEIDRIVKFRLSEASLAQRVWLEGGKPKGISAQEQKEAIAHYLVGLHDGLLFLADAVERLQIGEGEP